MKRDELVRMLNEGLSIEEIPLMSNLEELRNLVDNSNLADGIKEKMMGYITHLIRDEIEHAKTLSDLIRDAVK